MGQLGGDRAPVVTGRDLDALPVLGGGEGTDEDGGGQERGEAFLAQHGPHCIRVQTDHAGHLIGQVIQSGDDFLDLCRCASQQLLELVDDQQGRIPGSLPTEHVTYRQLDG